MPNSIPEYGQLILFQQVGDYVPEALLGEGAVATVYRAQLADNTPVDGIEDYPSHVALKVLRPEAVKQPQVLASFQYEARVLARLNHGGILRVYDTGSENGHVFLAMELLDGLGFDQYLLDKKRLPEEDAVSLASQLGEALDYLHKQGYVHRDIKPANLMVTYTGRLILFDFGTVIRISDGAPYEVGLYGTPAFVAPEQIEAGGPIDGRADLYSLGVILYLMVTGRKPFYGSRAEVLAAHQNVQPPPPSEFTRVSPDLEKIILKSISKEPDVRYQTGADFVQALTAAELIPPPARTGLSTHLFGWMRRGG